MTDTRNRRWFLVAAAGLLVVGAGLRLLAASRTAFWFDEVVTLDWSRGFGYWELITDPRTKHDNNHVLNSWWLRFVETWGVPDHWLPYRLWSVVTGTVGSVAMAWIGWRRSPLEGVLAAAFGALSYVLIHYSSECRGYASVCCFAALSWLAADAAFRRPGWPVTLAFWGCAALGVLSHSTYAFAYIAICVWSLAAWRQGQPGATLPRLVRLHAFPFLFLALLYFTRIRGMAIGGGPEFPLSRVFVTTLAHVVGWAWTRDWVGYGFAGVALGLIATECAGRAREWWASAANGTRDTSAARDTSDTSDRDTSHTNDASDARDTSDTSAASDASAASAAFYIALVVITPLLTALVLQPRIVYMRYFLVSMPFLLLLLAGLVARLWRCCPSTRQRDRRPSRLAGLVARLWRCCRWGRFAAVGLTLVVLGLNGYRVAMLVPHGRGQYLAALRQVVALDRGDPKEPIVVAGDVAIHIARLIGYSDAFLDRQVVFVAKSAARRPDWLISELQVPLPAAPASPDGTERDIAIRHGGSLYSLRGRFEYASVSGAHWYIFQRDR